MSILLLRASRSVTPYFSKGNFVGIHITLLVSKSGHVCVCEREKKKFINIYIDESVLCMRASRRQTSRKCNLEANGAR